MILTHGANSIGSNGLPEGFVKASFISLTNGQTDSFYRPSGLNGENKIITYKVICYNPGTIESSIRFGSFEISFYTGQNYFSYPYTGSVPYLDVPNPSNNTIRVYNTSVTTNYGNVNITSHPSPNYTDNYVNFKAVDSCIINLFEIVQKDGDNIEFSLIPVVDTNDNNKAYWIDTKSGGKWVSNGTGVLNENS